MPKLARSSFDGAANDAMTFVCGAMGAAWLYLCAQNGLLQQFAAYTVGCFAVIWGCGFVARPLARARGLNRTNANKTHEQLWQTARPFFSFFIPRPHALSPTARAAL